MTILQAVEKLKQKQSKLTQKIFSSLTDGAYPGIQAEARGQSEAIARNLREMAGLKVPVISVVIGEGCSGGALGIGVSDVFLMMQYSYFATISPEGCATILWKSADQAAEIMGITAQKLPGRNYFRFPHSSRYS